LIEEESMESVACNLCGSDQMIPVIMGRDRVFHPENTFHVVRCAECALAFLNPRPDAGELGYHYPLEYQTGLRDYSKSTRPMMKVGMGIWLRRRTPPLIPGGRMLDIGCSGGGYLLEMRKRGWEVHGIEMDPDVPRLKELGLDVRSGLAEEALAEFPDNHFDLVTSWHVLEHVMDPSRVLAEAYRVLKPGGLLMLEVPNFGSLARSVLRTYWFPLELPRHLYHFTPKTLGALLRKAGFEKVTLKGVPSALSDTLSLQLIWNRLTGNLKSRWLILNPVLLAIFFPISWLLAQFHWSSHMTADAVKTTSKSIRGSDATEKEDRT
jgi:2-polyprenyl-3-methyl-5-hydroxy-6-metoxy-1,4-benzoquinol methylase